MFRIKNNATLEELIDFFRKGVIRKEFGYDQVDKNIERQGFRMQCAAMRRIDRFGEPGRQALVALMYADPDQGVRTAAAGELRQDRPEIAIPVLRQIQKSGKASLKTAAGASLILYEMEIEHSDCEIAARVAKRRAVLAEAAARYEAETAKARGES